MKILVLMKEVPDMGRVRFDSERGVVDRAGAPAELNPFDENALEAAVRLAAAREDTGITVLMMGPPGAERSLRSAYARGADHTVLLSDRAFGGADTCATAKTLAAAIRKMGGFDLILCGEKSVDGDTAQVGAEVAEFLGIPHCYYADCIELREDKEIVVEIEELWGERQVRAMRLPALVGVTKNVAKPKLPTVDRRLASLEIAVTRFSLADLDGYLTADEAGAKGSPTRVARVAVPKEAARSPELYRENPENFCRRLREITGGAG